MSRVIEAIFRNGVLQPALPLDLPDQARVRLAIIDDPSARELAAVATAGSAFAFLDDPREDIYSLEDGEPV